MTNRADSYNRGPLRGCARIGTPRTHPRVEVFDATGVDRGRNLDPVDRDRLSDIIQRHTPSSRDLSHHVFVNGDVELISRRVTPHDAG